jgi:hypothetical protein
MECYLVNKIEKNEMGVACGQYGRQGRYLKRFGGGNPREIDH